jgi:PST family polysaccharide transporter
MKSKFLENGFWSLSNQFVRVGSLAVVMILLSRHFGPQRFGSLAVGLALVRIFAVIATFGLDRIVVRHLVEQSESRPAILREAFWLKLGIAVASYLAMLAFISVLQRGDALLLGIVMLAGGGLLFQACDVYDYAFQADGRFRFSFVARSVPILFSTAIKLAAIWFSAPLLVFAALETIEAAFIATAFYLIHRRTTAQTTMSILRTNIIWPRLLAQGLPLLLSALAIMIYMRSDIIMLGKMIGYEAAGIYAAASQISEACALLPVALMPALFPILVSWRRVGPDFYHRKFERLFLLAVIGGLVFSLGLTIGSSAIVDLIFGASYRAAAPVLAVHGWTLMFIFIGIAQSGYDVTENLTWFATARMFAGAVLNIALNLLFIPRFGVIGSAVATLVAQIFSSVLLNALHPRTRPILRMQLMSILIWPALRTLARERQSSDNRAWQPA